MPWVNFITTEPCSPEPWESWFIYGESSPWLALRFRLVKYDGLYPDKSPILSFSETGDSKIPKNSTAAALRDGHRQAKVGAPIAKLDVKTGMIYGILVHQLWKNTMAPFSGINICIN